MTANPLQSPQAGGGLLPCPFCQTGKPHVVNPASGAPPYVLCECGGAGAQRSTEAECIAAWNRRASTSGLAGEAVADERISRDRDIILEAINYYDGWMLDDDYDAHTCLRTIIEKMRQRASYTTPVTGEADAVPPSIPAGGVREALESQAWNCDEWPDWLHRIVAETSDVADRLDMSAEQAQAYAALAALSLPAGGVAVSDAELLDAMAKNIRLELSWGEVSDFEGEPCQWRVHERTGNRNDREWALVGFGATPAEAIRRARASVKGAGQS